MPAGRAVVEIVNCGFFKVSRGWLDQSRARLRSGLRHFRLIARQPEGERHALDGSAGWNANASVPWPALRSVLQAAIRTFAAHDLARRHAEALGRSARQRTAHEWPSLDCAIDGQCVDSAAHSAGNRTASRLWSEQCERACLALPTGRRELGCEGVNASKLEA